MRVSYEVRERDGTLVAGAVQMKFRVAVERCNFWLETGRNIRIWPSDLFPLEAAPGIVNEPGPEPSK